MDYHTSSAVECLWHQNRIDVSAGHKQQDQLMTKSSEVFSEAVRNSKFAFRKTENQPKKPQKHRYERRKIREYLHLADWLSADVA